jgi:hypothetical protein
MRTWPHFLPGQQLQSEARSIVHSAIHFQRHTETNPARRLTPVAEYGIFPPLARE